MDLFAILNALYHLLNEIVRQSQPDYVLRSGFRGSFGDAFEGQARRWNVERRHRDEFVESKAGPGCKYGVRRIHGVSSRPRVINNGSDSRSGGRLLCYLDVPNSICDEVGGWERGNDWKGG